jgi:hypothetical protein
MSERADAHMEIHYSGEWAALYVDGQLETVGDSPNTIEQALAILGVKEIHSSAFMRGQSKADGVARNLSDVELYRRELDDRIERAMRLRREAAEKVAEAKRLEDLDG